MSNNVDSRTFNVLSICTGYGGLDLGVRLAIPASRTIAYVEIEAYACAQLVARMSEGFLDDAPVWSDVRTFDGRPWRGRVHCIVAGYPCQPFSIAGQRKGEDDPRHLWPHIARIIREVCPLFVFLENVSNHLILGFENVRAELQAMGYRIEAGLFTAAETYAPHKRQRLFCLAYNHDFRQRQQEGREREERRLSGDGGERDVADAMRAGQQQIAGSASRDEAKNERRAAQSDHESSGVSPGVADAPLRRSGTGGSDVDDAAGARRDGWTPVACGSLRDEARRKESGRRRNLLGVGQADSQCARSQRRGPEDSERRGEPVPFRGEWGAFPPYPGDAISWRRILAEEPSLEPAFCGVVDGRTSRVDELRELGNGVLPVVAGFAFISLAEAFD